MTENKVKIIRKILTVGFTAINTPIKKVIMQTNQNATRKHERKNFIGRIFYIVFNFLHWLSDDLNAISFIVLSDFHTPFLKVDIIQTDYRFRNHYTLRYKVLLSLTFRAWFTGCLLLKCRYSFRFIPFPCGTQDAFIFIAAEG